METKTLSIAKHLEYKLGIRAEYIEQWAEMTLTDLEQLNTDILHGRVDLDELMKAMMDLDPVVYTVDNSLNYNEAEYAMAVEQDQTEYDEWELT